MDFTTIIGFVVGIGLLYFGAEQGGGLGVFLNLHGLAIVVGGTLAVTLINGSAATLVSTLHACVKLFFPDKDVDISKTVVMLRQWADNAKSNGIMALQENQKRLPKGFAQRAVNTAVTSGDAEFTRSVLEEDILQMRLRHQTVQSVLRTAGVLAPMIGLLGTLIGITSVLKQITDPSKVGPAMATALSTAFFGIFIAAFIAIPIAGKLRERSMRECLVRQLFIEGMVGILKADVPFLLEIRLRSFAHDKGVPTHAPAPKRPKAAA